MSRPCIRLPKQFLVNGGLTVVGLGLFPAELSTQVVGGCLLNQGVFDIGTHGSSPISVGNSGLPGSLECLEGSSEGGVSLPF